MPAGSWNTPRHCGRLGVQGRQDEQILRRPGSYGLQNGCIQILQAFSMEIDSKGISTSNPQNEYAVSMTII